MPTQTFRRFSLPWLALALVALTALTSVVTLRAQEVPALALPERRALKQYQDTRFTELQKSIRTAAGFEVPLEVKWETLARPGEGASYGLDTYWTNIYFAPLAAALRQVAADPAGAQALQAKLKKIVVAYDQATAPISNYAKGLTFEGGTLTINFEPNTNADDTEARTKAMVSTLEAKL